MFIAALFTIARTQKQLKCPSTDEWIKKMWHIYTEAAFISRNFSFLPPPAVLSYRASEAGNCG